MFSIENIGIAILASGIITFALYFATTQMKKDYLSGVHFIGLGILFILLSFQSYKFIGAWDDRTAIEETLVGINSLADDTIDFIDELDKQNGGTGDIGTQIKDAMNNPLLQKGLKIFGIDINMDGKMTIEMAEKLRSEYNWYMFRRVCWMLGFIILYFIIAMLTPTSLNGSYSDDRNTRRFSSQKRFHSRRR